MRKTPRVALSTWRRAALVSVLLFLSTCWILLDSVLFLTEGEGTLVEIPSFCGREECGIERVPHLIFRTEYRYDDNVACGVVISQEPRAGEVLPVGETVVLWVGVKAPTRTVRVPSLLGQSRAEASLSLAAAGLSLGEIAETEDTEVEAGTVVSQSHLPDTTVLAGTKISITVAKESEEYVFWQRSDHGE